MCRPTGLTEVAGRALGADPRGPICAMSEVPGAVLEDGVTGDAADGSARVDDPLDASPLGLMIGTIAPLRPSTPTLIP